MTPDGPGFFCCTGTHATLETPSMKRTFATTTLAVAVLSMTACKGGAGDSVKLVPDAAIMVAGVDVKGVMGSKLYTDFKEKIEASSKEELEAFKKCNLGPDTWKSAIVGADPTKGEGAVVVVLTADGVGKKENLECVNKEGKAANGDKDLFTFEEDGKVLKMEDDKGVVYVINDNTVAYAGKDWAAPVKELRDGKGKSAIDGSLKALVGRTDSGKHIWFAGTVPSDMGGMASGMAGFTPKDVTGWVDLSSGLSLQMAAGADDAEKVAGELNTKIEAGKALATAQGIPETAVNSVKVGNKDGAVTVEASLSDADLKTLTDKATAMMPPGM